MSLPLTVTAYAVYAAFFVRLSWHFLLWMRASHALMQAYPSSRLRPSLVTRVLMAIDIVTLRRVFVANGPLWFGSLLFHLSFLFVLLRHVRYFSDPVPDCIQGLQTCGVIAGYLLPASVLWLLALRIVPRGNRYLSWHNYVILGLTLCIGATGLMMKTLFRTDLIAVKLFTMGLLTFHPTAFRDSYLFVLHFALVLILVLLLPSHIFSAPLTTMEARRREDTLRRLMHND